MLDNTKPQDLHWSESIFNKNFKKLYFSFDDLPPVGYAKLMQVNPVTGKRYPHAYLNKILLHSVDSWKYDKAAVLETYKLNKSGIPVSRQTGKAVTKKANKRHEVRYILTKGSNIPTSCTVTEQLDGTLYLQSWREVRSDNKHENHVLEPSKQCKVPHFQRNVKPFAIGVPCAPDGSDVASGTIRKGANNIRGATSQYTWVFRSSQGDYSSMEQVKQTHDRVTSYANREAPDSIYYTIMNKNADSSYHALVDAVAFTGMKVTRFKSRDL